MELVFEHKIKRTGGSLIIQIFKQSETKFLRRNTLIFKGRRTTIEMFLTAEEFEKFKQSALAFKGIENTN